MVEPRSDMMPPNDPSGMIETSSITVGGDVKPATPAPVVLEETPVSLPPAPHVEVPKGSKTPEPLLYKSLSEERTKRQALERELAELKASSQSYDPSDDVLSDEGRALKKMIVEGNIKIATLESQLSNERIFGEYPQLKDKASEFDTFKADYPGVEVAKVAKLFLVENDLLGKPSRKGLERSTGGPKTATPSGTPAAEIDRLMKDEPKKFARMLQRGEIDVDNIR